eukprot:jgi/Ulvmu1/12324/UM089_0008.1
MRSAKGDQASAARALAARKQDAMALVPTGAATPPMLAHASCSSTATKSTPARSPCSRPGIPLSMLCVLKLWLAIGMSTAVPAAIARSLNEAAVRWQPTPDGAITTALALRSQSGDVAFESDEVPPAPRRTIMHCLGTTTLTRACHFENVYYEIGKKRFAYYGPEGSTPDQFGDINPKEPWLRLVRDARPYRGQQPWRTQERAIQFDMDWRAGQSLPAAKHVVTFRQPLHLRALMNTKSIGHLLRDNLSALIDLPIRFGRDPIAFDWVRWESQQEFSSWEVEANTAIHYRGLLNNRPSVTWQEVLRSALDGQENSVKFIQFSEIIAGQGPADLLTHLHHPTRKNDEEHRAEWAHMCQPAMFANMRDVAYRNFGLKVASVVDLEPFVLFLDGRNGEKRHLTNAEALIPKLKQRFPGVRMEHVVSSAQPLEEQLDYLSKATVVVSNIGSRSFRLIYLPNGATTILVGPPEFEFELPPEKAGKPVIKEKVPMPFQEIVSCWAFIGYVQMLQYHVRSEEEVMRTKEWTTVVDARNVDIILDEAKLSRLLQTALQRQSSSIAYQGSGLLSSYDTPVSGDE